MTLPPRRRRRWPIVFGLLALAIVLLIALWDWDWFRPLVEAQASAAIGRRVTIRHFGLRLGWHPVATADGLAVADPSEFPEAPDFATADRLAVTADVRAYLRGRRIVLERVEVQHPQVNAIAHPDGHATWDFPALAGGKPATTKPAGSGVQVGDLVIEDGHAHVVDPAVRADFALAVKTTEPSGGAPGQIVVDADGSYAKQRITGHATGATLLSLRDAAHPYPIRAAIQNGPTKVTLQGTVQDPLHFAGTSLQMHLSGPDMALLFPLTGIPIPQTPPYDISGKLAYTAQQIEFTDFHGRLGASDVGGTIGVQPGSPRATVSANLTSRRIDLADLGGFIGSQPGRPSTPGQTAEQKRAVQKAVASPQLLPTAPINVPKLTAADVHLRWRADRIEGRSIPFDTFAVTLDIRDGRIEVHPVTLGVGEGRLVGNIALAPTSGQEFRTRSDVTFDRVDIGRMLAATHLVHGAGLLGGEAKLDATGNSVATLVGHGDGGVRLLLSGGNLSALLVDLSGLELGNALLSALGLPNRATLQCLAVDMPLRRGVLDVQTFLIDTSEADVLGSGSIDLASERMDLTVRTLSRHFSVGSLPTPIRIRGSFKDPSIAPAAGPLAARTGAAVALGVLLTPLGALLPTVQFGTGAKNLDRCEAVVRQDERTLPTAAVPPARAGAAVRTGRSR